MDEDERRRAERTHLRIVREGARARARARAGLGRSGGGLTTKIHAASNRRCRVLTHVISPGQRGDARGFFPVMATLKISRGGPGRPRTRPDAVLADKTYSSAAIRAHLRRRGIKAVIPVKADQVEGQRRRGSKGGRPPCFDKLAYRERNVFERAFSKIKRWRAVALRTDKRLFVYTGTVAVAVMSVCLRDLIEIHETRPSRPRCR